MAAKLTETEIDKRVQLIIRETLLQVGETISQHGLEAMLNVGLAAYQANTAEEAKKSLSAGKEELAKAVHLSATLAAEGILRAVFLISSRTDNWEDRIREEMNDIIIQALAQIEDNKE